MRVQEKAAGASSLRSPIDTAEGDSVVPTTIDAKTVLMMGLIMMMVGSNLRPHNLILHNSMP